MPENQATHIHTSAEYESCEECKARATRETRGTPLAPKLLEQAYHLLSEWDNTRDEVCCEGTKVNSCALHKWLADFQLNFSEMSEPVAPPPRPKIICLCGSTKFIEMFAVKTWELELEGNIVLGCTLLPKWYCPVRDHFAETLGVKEQRDNHHLQKIDLADEILVLNVNGYIGESTRREIEYAEAHGKPVKYLVTNLEASAAPAGTQPAQEGK